MLVPAVQGDLVDRRKRARLRREASRSLQEESSGGDTAAIPALVVRDENNVNQGGAIAPASSATQAIAQDTESVHAAPASLSLVADAPSPIAKQVSHGKSSYARLNKLVISEPLTVII